MKDQSVLVVGASSGIGREAAVLFAREGAKVTAVARRQERLEELQKQLAGEGHPIEIATADAGVATQMQDAAKQALAKFGKIDVMVYVTGTNTLNRYLDKLTPEVWDEMIRVNLNGAFYVTYAVLPSMRDAGRGHLIYISSISGIVPDVSGSAYQASKRGMIGLSHAVRVEEKEKGIRTCVICPGLVESELLEKRPVKPTAELLAKAMQPGDVAEAILAVAKLPERAVVPEMQLLPTKL